MAAVIGKRKRENGHVAHVQFKKAATGLEPEEEGSHHAVQQVDSSTPHSTEATTKPVFADHVPVQIVTGSYERVLHGICANIPSALLRRTSPSGNQAEQKGSDKAQGGILFSDSFLFAAHSSSIRCLALSSPTESGKRILATGSSDERINLYQLSTAPPLPEGKQSIPTYEETPTTINSRNRSLGNLIHHERAITRLQFPTKSKLFSAAEDNAVAVSRTRDWTVLSSIKAPIPKPQGRPSGDTAGPGEVPAGINDFAIHPSQKLMLSVGRGERCMRLWNLMTGKKAGVLNFDRDLLSQVGEGRHSSGEGRRVVWNENGETFVIAFERGIVLFGLVSKPKAIIRPSPATKIHQMRFVPSTSTSTHEDVLAVSTEDGRVLFFDTSAQQDQPDTKDLPPCKCIGALGGPAAGVSGRLKDFDILPLTNSDGEELFLLASGSSDGAVRFWTFFASEFGQTRDLVNDDGDDGNATVNGTNSEVPHVGRLIGMIETGNRITCLGAFVMDGKPETMGEDELLKEEENVDQSSSDSEA